MDNNEQNMKETPTMESPKNEPQKAKTTTKQNADSKETVKKTTRKTRSTKTLKAKKAIEKKDSTEKNTEETGLEVTAEQQNEVTTTITTNKEVVPEKKNEEAAEIATLKQQTAKEKTEETTDNNTQQADNNKPANGKQEQKIPSLPSIRINNIIELLQAPMRNIVLTDQQIQQLTMEEIEKRHVFLEETLTRVLDYDVVISDTNVWLELLVGYTSSHSDPRFNARLQFERQLEFISKLMHHRGGRFIMMGETYEEIDRFASMQDPANHRDADFTDNMVCLNTAARLAKRLILAQQRENRLRIDGIGAESHHASFADPAIIRKVADLFAEGKKVLLLTNDASVAIRAMGICDDLQRHNEIPDAEWDKTYAPLRPMVFTFDDLKLLDFYTRQYHYMQMAAGVPWMNDIKPEIQRNRPEPLSLWMDAFRPGDKHRGDNLFTDQEKQTQQKIKIQKQQEQQKKQLAQQEQQKKQQTQQEQQKKQLTQQEQQKKQQTQPKKQTQPQQQKQIQQKKTKTVAPIKAENNTSIQEQQPTEVVITTEKKEEQKQNTRTRKKSSKETNSSKKAAQQSNITESKEKSQ